MSLLRFIAVFCCAALAAGCAVGAFVSFTPYLGFHIAISIALAWLIRGNLIAAAIGTSVGNPLTFPLIWASTYQLGHAILRGEQAVTPPPFGRHILERSIENLSPLIKTMSVGALPLGFLAGLAISAVCLIWASGFWSTVLSIAISYLAFILFKTWCERRFGGQTGDVLGATQVITELTVLIAVATTIS